MKTLLLFIALAAADAGTRVPAPKPCVVQTPRGPRACAPEPKTPASCSVRVLLPDGRTRTLPCR